MNVDSRTLKRIASKGATLQRCFDNFEAEKKQVIQKFEYVWGVSMASHFLSKYNNADSLIWALDSDNLDLFIEKF